MQIKKNLARLLVIYSLATGLGFPEVESVSQVRRGNLESIGKEKKPQNKIEKYALAITEWESWGDDYRSNWPWDQLDMLTAFNSLRKLGFPEENMYFLNAEELNVGYPVSGISNKEGIYKTIELLVNQVDSNDVLFVYLSGHGIRHEKDDGKFHYFKRVCDDDSIEVGELKERLDRISSKTTILLANVCYSGGLASEFSDGKYVGISSSSDSTETFTGQDLSFGREFMTALATPEEHDMNNDGRVSITEAFHYADSIMSITPNYWVMHPQLKTTINADSLFLK